MQPQSALQSTSQGDDVRILAAMAHISGDARTEDVTPLLDAWRGGDEEALVRLMEVVQDELHRIARNLFGGERRDHTLQATAVVNELHLRFSKLRRIGVRSRSELLAVAAHMMRRVLVDHARRHKAGKRGGGAVHLELEESLGLPVGRGHEILALNDASIDLERRSSRQSRIVELRLMVGLTLQEIARLESISPSQCPSLPCGTPRGSKRLPMDSRSA